MLHTSSDTTFVTNFTECDPIRNPWCGRNETGKVVELVFLFALAVVGTLGNLLVILSIAVEKKAHKFGNMFIINLAIADVMVNFYFQ